MTKSWSTDGMGLPMFFQKVHWSTTVLQRQIEYRKSFWIKDTPPSCTAFVTRFLESPCVSLEPGPVYSLLPKNWEVIYWNLILSRRALRALIASWLNHEEPNIGASSEMVFPFHTNHVRSFSNIASFFRYFLTKQEIRREWFERQSFL